MVNIMIDIRHISRCVIRHSIQSGLYYMRLRYTIVVKTYPSIDPIVAPPPDLINT